MIKRLRPAHPAARLAEIYATPHDHYRFGRGHGERVDRMIELLDGTTWDSAADLSCGNGVVLTAANAWLKHYGDYAPGYEYTGPIEDTLQSLPPVDLFVLGETLEHLDDPGLVLSMIEARSRVLLMSTPVDCWDDSNEEHYWAWDREGVEELLAEAAAGTGPADLRFTDVDTRTYGEPYRYGIWLVRW